MCGLAALIISANVSADLFKDESGFGIKKREFLPAEEAFISTIEVADANTVIAKWTIQDGYYLYKDKFAFTSADPDVQIESIDLPKGEEKEDPLFGRVEVYHGDLSIPVHLKRAGATATELELEAAYQGCAEDGICYPPLKTLLPVMLPAASAATLPGSITPATANTNTDPVPETDSIAASLASKPVLINLLLFFGFGLALSLTPCVFPMIPILSGILVGQAQNLTSRKSFILSLVYVLGMALTYAIVGVIAGLFGKNLQAAFQAPWVLASFSAVFVLLALSMFGFYNIQLPASLQSRLTTLSHSQERGTLHGTALMGIFSAIIVGPCVAPPLAGALIYIGQSGNALLGGVALFIMGLGMGVPLLLLGASAGKLLPRAGGWMNVVKHVFGVLMLAVAIWLLERIISPQVTLALWGLLLIGSAVYMGAFDPLHDISTGWQRLWKGLGIAMVIYGALLIIGSASGANDVFQPLKNLTVTQRTNDQPDELQFTPIKGIDGLKSALKTAYAQNKTVMLDFYADWCIECKRMEKSTFSDPRVRDQLKNTLLLQADVTPNDREDQNLLKSLGLYGPPAILFFSPDGTEKRHFRITGYTDPTAFHHHLAEVFNQ